MKNYARIENGKVAELLQADELPEFHPSLIWVEAAGNVLVGWLFNGESFAEPDSDPPILKTKFTSLEFLDRFTEDEQLDVVQATMASAPVKLWYDRLLAASFVDFEDPRTAGGIDALINAGLVAADRRAALLAPEQV